MANCFMSIINKKNKKLARKFNRLILEFKALDEARQDILEEEQEGNIDLLFRVNNFQNRIAKDQQRAFKKNILGISESDTVLQAVTASDSDEEESTTIAVHENKLQEKTWQKKLLRSIVMKTHPDKLGHFPAEDREYFTEVCRIAMESFETGSDVKLMATGHDVRIKPGNLSGHHIKLIEKELPAIVKKIETSRVSHGYIWYNLTESEKEVFLTNYLTQLGFKVDKEEVKEAIKSRRPNARKPGTRPERILKNRVNKDST